MRIITKDIQLTIDGSPLGFRLTKPDAFSGVEILRLLLRLQDHWGEAEQGAFRSPPPVADEGGETLSCFVRSANAELQNRPPVLPAPRTPQTLQNRPPVLPAPRTPQTLQDHPRRSDQLAAIPSKPS
jgi:hypothetical protein